MHGPFAGSRNDKEMMKKSRFGRRFYRWCVLNNEYYVVYGDQGYVMEPCVIVPFCRIGARSHERRFNRAMSKVRISVEWGFGEVARYFAFCAYPYDLKLDKQPVATYWRVAALLYNCRSCLYGNQSNRYYGVETPDLEDYLYDI